MKKRNVQLNKNYRTLVASILMLLLLILVGGYLTYSWYFIGDETGKMEFQVLQIDSVVTMYYANDINQNGVPDLLSANNKNDGTYQYTEVDEETGDSITNYVAYDLPYYTEIYDFTYHDTSLVLAEDSIANEFTPLVLEGLFPSGINTIKFALANYNFGTNDITFGFDSKSSYDTVAGKDELSQFRMRLAKVNDAGSLVFGDWTFFQFNGDQLQKTTIKVIDDKESIDPYTGDSGSGRLDVWLQIQFVPEATNVSMDKNIVFPDFRITFDAEYRIGE